MKSFFCPNKNDDKFKLLKKVFGEEAATEFFINLQDEGMQTKFTVPDKLELFNGLKGEKDWYFNDIDGNPIPVQTLMPFFGNPEKKITQLKTIIDQFRKNPEIKDDAWRLHVAFMDKMSELLNEDQYEMAKKFANSHRIELYGKKTLIDTEEVIYKKSESPEKISEDETEDSPIEEQTGNRGFDQDGKKAESTLKKYGPLLIHLKKKGIQKAKEQMIDLAHQFKEWTFTNYTKEDLSEWLEEQNKGLDTERICQTLLHGKDLGIDFAHKTLNELSSIEYRIPIAEKRTLNYDIESQDFNREFKEYSLANSIKRSLDNFIYEKKIEGKEDKEFFRPGSESLHYAHQDYMDERESELKKIQQKYYGSPELEKRLRLKRLAIDLKFMNKITGTDWTPYFTSKFERVFDKNGNSLKFNNLFDVFDTNEMLFRDKDGKHIKETADLFFSLITPLKIKDTTHPVYKDWAFRKVSESFNPDLAREFNYKLTKKVEGIDSNIVKLAKSFAVTAKKIAVRFAGKRESMLTMNSHLTRRSKDVLTASEEELKGNPVVRWQNEKKESFNVQPLLGFSAYTSTGLKDVPFEKMNSFDLSLCLLKHFERGLESKSYMLWMGQFGGKEDVMLVEVPVHEFTDKQKEDLRKLLGEKEFKEDVDDAKSILSKSDEEGESEIFPGWFGLVTEEARKDFAEKFVYNNIYNKKYINDWFQGKMSSYDKKGKYSFINQIKRAHNILSSGVLYDTKIKDGIGKEHRHLIIEDIPGFVPESGDGCNVFSGKQGIKKAISLGQENPMTCSKDNISYVDDKNHRWNFKGNSWNIDTLEPLGGIFKDLKDIIDENNIDYISPNSVIKVQGDKSIKPLKLFDENNKLIKYSKEEIKKRIIIVDNNNIVYQQDLRNSQVPKPDKRSVQMESNTMRFQSFDKMNNRFTAIKDKLVDKLQSDYFKDGFEETIKKQLKENSDDDPMLNYIKKGGKLSNPYYITKATYKVANIIQKRLLDTNVNRVRLQCIPQFNSPLKKSQLVYSNTFGKERRTLPEANVGIEGLRAEEIHNDLKTLEETHQYIVDHKEKYWDLVSSIKDDKGNIKIVANDWEIQELGVIPGEPHIGTRIPADAMHSHSLTRVKKIIGIINAIQLPEEIRTAKSEDFDGDCEFVEVLNKKKGNITTEGVNGLLNQNILDLLQEFYDNDNYDLFSTAINTDVFNDIIDRLESKQGSESKKLSEAKNALSFVNDKLIRKSNQVSRMGIGVIANLNTSFDYIHKLGVQLLPKNKKFAKLIISKSDSKMFTTDLNGFVNDRFGLVKNYIGNIENLVLDNANLQKLFPLGINTYNIKIAIAMLITNKKIDTYKTKTNQDKYILDYCDAIFSYLNSSISKRYEQLMVNNERAGEKDETSVYEKLQESFPPEEFYNFWQIKQIGDDIGKLMKFVSLSRDSINTISDYIKGIYTLNSLNSPTGLRSISTTQIADKGKINKLFDRAIDNIKLEKLLSFGNSIELSLVGKEVLSHMESVLGRFLDYMDDNTLNNISKSLKIYLSNKITRGKNKAGETINDFESLQSSLANYMFTDEAKEKHKGPSGTNQFLSSLMVNEETLSDKSIYKTISIIPKLMEEELSQEQIEHIHDDFNRLPDTWQDLIFNYIVKKYELNEGSYDGNPIDLISPEYMVKYGNEYENELVKWRNGNMSEQEVMYLQNYVYNFNKMSGYDFNTKRMRNNLLNGMKEFTGEDYSRLKSEVNRNFLELKIDKGLTEMDYKISENMFSLERLLPFKTVGKKEAKTLSHYLYALTAEKDFKKAEAILGANSIEEAKKIAEKEFNYNFLQKVVLQQFLTMDNEVIRTKMQNDLIDTGNKYLVYTSDDNVLGIGPDGKGQNLMGKALIEVRKELMSEKNKERLGIGQSTEPIIPLQEEAKPIESEITSKKMSLISNNLTPEKKDTLIEAAKNDAISLEDFNKLLDHFKNC